MNKEKITWPEQLKEGGWRIKKESAFRLSYFRLKAGLHQTIRFHETTGAFVLLNNNNEITAISESLSAILRQAND